LPHASFRFEAGDSLLFGSETTGLSAEILDSLPEDRVLKLPMVAGSRSLNLSNAAAVAIYEAWRQLSFQGSDQGSD
jgi:tRNA(Leu) C34 or U34 (ribose-2'-O)-methylase TrmL